LLRVISSVHRSSVALKTP